MIFKVIRLPYLDFTPRNVIGFYEYDGPDANLLYIALNAAEQKYKYGLDVIFIDDFDMLALYNGSGKNIIASRLKQLAEKLSVAIILTAQIKRLHIYGDCLENLNLQLVRVICFSRLDVMVTYDEISNGAVKMGETDLTVMKNNDDACGYARITFDYSNGVFFNI